MVITAIDADVTSIEASRSRMEVLDDLAAICYRRGYPEVGASLTHLAAANDIRRA